MFRIGWRGWSRLRAVFLFLARPYLGKGDDMDRGRIADGRVPGALSRSLDAHDPRAVSSWTRQSKQRGGQLGPMIAEKTERAVQAALSVP
jgi:hypothetical protein